jgi:hypothetical protein
MERQLIDWIPREYRKRVSLTGSAHSGDGNQFRILVTNLSYAGCQFLSDERISRGDRLIVYLPGMGEIAGQARWVKGARCGVRFLIGLSSTDDRRARIGV